MTDPRRYVSVRVGPDGYLRSTVISGGMPEIADTLAPEVAQQAFLRMHPEGCPPERIPLWNGEAGEFMSLSFLIRCLRQGTHDGTGWRDVPLLPSEAPGAPLTTEST